jgi:hypothetical protein
MWRWALAAACAVTASLLVSPAVSTQPRAARYITLADARPLLAQLAAARPPDLPPLSGTQANQAWLTWIATHDRAIRRRLREGDEDTLVNWLLLGRSFTSLPPVIVLSSASEAAVASAAELIRARVDALVQALASPGDDERRLFARAYLAAQGVRSGGDSGRIATRDYLLKAVQRMFDDGKGPQPTSRAAATTPASAFEHRGLSLDTTIQPNFAVERSLLNLKARGLIAPASVRRVAIVGAGLDFADKNTGFDFYPVQTVQPFAVLDALRRLGLVDSAANVDIVALDISARVRDHISAARKAAPGGYVLQLPLARTAAWTSDLRRYWNTFGDQIGTALPPQAAAQPAVDLRSVRVSPAAVSAVTAEDVNIITERSRSAPFDLVIATNVLLYYGPFDQALALSNVGAMLTDRGVFLTNTALPDVPSSGLKRVGSEVTLYTTDGRGDEIIWYARTGAPPAPQR